MGWTLKLEKSELWRLRNHPVSVQLALKALQAVAVGPHGFTGQSFGVILKELNHRAPYHPQPYPNN